MESDHKTLCDAELWAGAVEGDKEAFSILYERYLEPLYRYCYYRVADEAEAEDLVETVFLKLWEMLPKLAEGSQIRNFKAWVYRIAHNLIIDRHRTLRPTSPLSEQHPLADNVPSAEGVIVINEEAGRIARAIASLDGQLQQVVVCRFINQLSHAETAEIMGLNEGHVRVLQYRALKKLRTLLSEES